MTYGRDINKINLEIEILEKEIEIDLLNKKIKKSAQNKLNSNTIHHGPDSSTNTAINPNDTSNESEKKKLIKMLISSSVNKTGGSNKKRKDSKNNSINNLINNNDYKKGDIIELNNKNKNNKDRVNIVDDVQSTITKDVQHTITKDVQSTITNDVQSTITNDVQSTITSNKEKVISQIHVNSSTFTDNECYNDYMINFKSQITFNNLEISNINIPKNESENVSEDNNVLSVIVNGDKYTFELEENYYNRYEILDFINDAFNSNNIDINCFIDNDKYVFKSNNRFNLDIGDKKSILPFLGFNNSKYNNRTSYTADTTINIGDNIFYLILSPIHDEPLYEINNDDNTIKKLVNLDDNSMKLDHLIVQFYKTKKDLIKYNTNYNFFFKNKHEFTVNLIS
jgi:hypothetical protein